MPLEARLATPNCAVVLSSLASCHGAVLVLSSNMCFVWCFQRMLEGVTKGIDPIVNIEIQQKNSIQDYQFGRFVDFLKIVVQQPSFVPKVRRMPPPLFRLDLGELPHNMLPPPFPVCQPHPLEFSTKASQPSHIHNTSKNPTHRRDGTFPITQPQL